MAVIQNRRNNELFTNGDNPDASPLRLFGDAKDKINRLYDKLSVCIDKANKFLSRQDLESGIISQVELERLCKLNQTIYDIRTVLSRDQMKVAFFGRTSNGKSSVINAILQDRILPTGIGHTTNCFLEIQGIKEEEAYLIVGGQDRRSIQSVAHLANALRSNRLEDSSLVSIHWPVAKCPLLKYDVVLVDSPGVDVDRDVDGWIDKHCLDADVFVLVSNAESTLMQREKEFFHKVNEKLSKPNIFILNNRWDASVGEIDADSVRKQHQDRAVKFLSEELKIIPQSEAPQRIYFVSAKEVLDTRTNKEFIKYEGYQTRFDEFLEFERNFEECLSKSAVKTKFKQHTDRGRATMNELTALLDRILAESLNVMDSKEKHFQEKTKSRQFIEENFQETTTVVKHQIESTGTRIDEMAAKTLNDEIRKLNLVIDDFHARFSSELMALSLYKAQLNTHVEKQLGENLRIKLSRIVSQHVGRAHREMLDKITPLLSEARRQSNISNLQKDYDFDELFNIPNCSTLFSDFREDLEFRFSLGIVSIIQRFQNKFMDRHVTYEKKLIDPKQSDMDLVNSSFASQNQEVKSTGFDFLATLERTILIAPQSQTTIGSLAVGGVLVRTVGWRFIIATASIYGALYMYEYLTWTDSAKERAFKKQYVRHATKKLRLFIDVTSKSISYHVKR